MTAVFDDPFEPALERCRLPADERADELRLRDDAESPLREDAADERRLDALVLLGLLREADEPPLPELLRDAVCRLLVERVLAWAIAPP